MNISAYIRLMRLDKPVGILLLWYPTAWALWTAQQGTPPIMLILYFFLGTVLMRSAGCVMNDIADRHIDHQVRRTQLRPLTAGELKLGQALSLLFLLLICSLLILLCLPKNCFYWALIAVFIAFIYPFCKRIIQAPQLVLGLAFSMGIPMAYVALKQAFDAAGFILCLINFLWIIAYDSMYAMTDRADDLKIGVQSTAILFGSYDVKIITMLNMIMHGLWLYWAYLVDASLSFYLFWCIGIMVLVYQYQLIKCRAPQNCFKAFRVANLYGAMMWLAILFTF